jgi:hypothetical protein
MGKTKSVEDVDLVGRYEAVRDTLLQERFADRMSKPLGYWVLPSDRRLPLAFLGRTLGDLLATPFSELSATPGIGEKKISSLVKLLHRATDDQPPAVPVGLSTTAPSAAESVSETGQQLSHFNPSLVSEALWSEWRDVVRRYGIGEETLGRLAPSLQNLPTVIWQTPMAYYLDYTVAQIRGLRTHGEKRVRCVLEVFHSVAQRLAKAQPSENLHVLLTAPLIRDVQDWVTPLLEETRIPNVAEVRERLAIPVLQQINIDSGDTVHRLATERLGLSGGPVSVRAQARNLGVTRARIYQLLDDCSKVFQVRWPAGAKQLEGLALRFAAEGADAATSRLFFGVRELCFPDKKRESEQRNVPVESNQQTTDEEPSLATMIGLSSS